MTILSRLIFLQFSCKWIASSIAGVSKSLVVSVEVDIVYAIYGFDPTITSSLYVFCLPSALRLTTSFPVSSRTTSKEHTYLLHSMTNADTIGPPVLQAQIPRSWTRLTHGTAVQPQQSRIEASIELPDPAIGKLLHSLPAKIHCRQAASGEPKTVRSKEPGFLGLTIVWVGVGLNQQPCFSLVERGRGNGKYQGSIQGSAANVSGRRAPGSWAYDHWSSSELVCEVVSKKMCEEQ